MSRGLVSVVRPGRLPARERDDVPGCVCAQIAELLVLQGELVDNADEGGDVSAELGEFLVLGGDCVLELRDGGAEAGLVAVIRAAFLDALVELVLQAWGTSARLITDKFQPNSAISKTARATASSRVRNSRWQVGPPAPKALR